MHKKHSVIIVGSGITALATALKLQAYNLSDIALIIPTQQNHTESALAPGFAQASCFDNLTRVAQAHGKDFAGELTRWTQGAFTSLAKTARDLGIPWHQQPSRLRFIVAPDELIESKEAVSLMQQCGYASTLIMKDDAPYDVASRVIAVQTDPLPCAYMDSAKLLSALRTKVQNRITWYEGEVTKVTSSPTDLTLTVQSGSDLTLKTDMLVLGHHLGIKQLLPETEEMLFPAIDQWLEITYAAPAKPDRVGTFWSAHHCHEWGGILPGKHLRFCMGGGRYLRSAEGVDAPDTKPSLNGRVGKFLLQKLQQTFNLTLPIHSIIGQVGVSCKTCDELPAIGPWIGEHRILMATGFQNQGLTLGFQAGQHLADCIMTGQMPGLPGRLHPRRWMTLMEQ